MTFTLTFTETQLYTLFTALYYEIVQAQTAQDKALLLDLVETLKSQLLE